MAVEWIREIEGSRTGNDTLDAGSTAVMKWAVFGDDDVPTMRAALWPYVPPTYQAANATRPLEFRGLDRQQLGYQLWEWTANYADPERTPEKLPEQGEAVWTFDTTGGTGRLYVSRKTTKYPANAADFKGAIGVKTDRDIEGCDIVIPVLKLTAQYRHPPRPGQTTRGLARELYGLTGTVCEHEFGEYEPGELLFLGAAAQMSNTQGITVSYNFAASYNETGLTIGDIPNVAKDGHDYLWIRFSDAHDSGTLTRRPKAAYVERVYRRAPWDALALLLS